jgi:phosphonate transport system permease protein
MSDTSFILPSKKYKKKITFFIVASVILLAACYYLNFNPFLFFSEFHFVKDLLDEMFMPDYHVLWDSSSIGLSILQTLSMAFLGTIIGGVFAMLLSFFAAKNTMPYSVIRFSTRFFLTLLRVVPSLVVILIFVIAVGPGAFAGVLALVFSTIGTFGKLFTEVLENSLHSPSEAIFSVGASKIQVIKFSIFPQVLPALISNLLYSFDINMRAAIALGIFGGGGIGYKLHMAMRVLHYKDATALITFIIVMVMLVEKISDYLRSKILNAGKLI